MYKCTAAIMHFGNSQWKQRPREEQAEAEGTQECEKVAHLLGIEAAELIKGLLKPRIKVCATPLRRMGTARAIISSSVGR